jgi:hypothetical protein
MRIEGRPDIEHSEPYLSACSTANPLLVYDKDIDRQARFWSSAAMDDDSTYVAEDDADWFTSDDEQIAEEIWSMYGGEEAFLERHKTLWELCRGDVNIYEERAEKETKEWLAWHTILSSQDFPPQRIPGSDEVKRLAGTHTRQNCKIPHPVQIPSLKYEKERGTWRKANLVRLPPFKSRQLPLEEEDLDECTPCSW